MPAVAEGLFCSMANIIQDEHLHDEGPATIVLQRGWQAIP